MGLDDRTYLRRSDGAGSGRLRMPVWSVTTWLIVICVGIFVIDGFLPVRFVPTGDITILPTIDPLSLDGSTLEVGDERRFVVTQQGPDGRPVELVRVRREIVVGPDRTVVGHVDTRAMPFISSFLYFSTSRLIHGIEYWRVIGFQFLHDQRNLGHLLFNMLGLFFFGPLVERHLGGKRYLAFYLLCGIAGAMMYLLLSVLGMAVESLLGPGARLPGLLFYDMDTPLIGASAGVYGILLAGAYLAPSTKVLLFFIIPMRLATLAYALVVLSLLSVLLDASNAGGHAAHLGGAITGWYLIRRPALLHGFFDVLGRIDPTSRSGRAHRNAQRATQAHPPDEIDRILDKITAHGIHSLDEKERAALRDVSKRPER